MPYDDPFLKTQIGRSVKVHFGPPAGSKGKDVVKHGRLVDVKEGRVVVHVGEEYPVQVRCDADQPAFAERDRTGSLWWEFLGPQLPLG